MGYVNWEIGNNEDRIDSRAVDERIGYLERMRDAASGSDYSDSELLFDEGEAEELAALLALREQAQQYAGSQWRDGVELIRNDWFPEYAEEWAEETGAVSRDAEWPHNHIDWDEAADDLKQNYSQVDFDGVAYQVRNC